MKMQDLTEWGKIVKGVNTTVDVGVNQIPIEASKFGNKVDKNGRPPTMSNAVKGKSTNVLFNLGLTEGIRLRLERDKNMDVLHIQDTKEKHRVEVRGKKGYEANGYDPNDKLHQVLDRVGKAANISELMNGEVVDINPNHPQGSRAIRTARDVLQTEDTTPRYTAAEWAIIEGGHSLDDLDKPTPTIAELVKMHGVPAKQILKQLEIGIEAEYEHTSDFEVAKQIAMDHIAEDPAYYDKLKFIESPRPRMSPADIAADTRASSTGVSQAELQRLTSQYRSQPPNAIVSLLNSFDADTVISIALAIGAPHLSFLQRFLIRRGTRFSRNLMQQAMAQVEGITEALDQPYPVRWTMKDDDEWEGKAKTEAGDSIQIMITQGHNNHKWEIDFYVGGSMQVTGKGDQFRVFATVVSAVKKWWSWLSKSKQPVEAIIFSAFKGNKSAKGSAGRSSLYNRFANQFARSIGFTVSTVDGSDNIKFVLTNPNYKDQQTENFADGKKKGKSRPGRVKKAGASCNGSVTDLRKRAKKYSGERGRMYHWCANMKSGRKKS